MDAPSDRVPAPTLQYLTRTRTGSVLGVALALVVSAGCGTGDDSASPSSTASPTTTAVTSTTATSAFEPSEEQDAWITELEAAIDALLRSPGATIDFSTENVDGGSTTGTVRIDNSSGDHESTERLSSELNESVIVVTENVLVGDELHNRIYPDDMDPAEVGWTTVEPGPLRAQLAGEAYTASGAIGASLERLVVLLRNVPWTPEGSAVTDVDGVLVRSLLVRFDAEEIRRYFRDSGLERTGPAPARGSTIYEFWIDANDPVLIRILAAGTLFQNGEPLEDATAEVTFLPLDEIRVDVPTDLTGQS